MLVRSQGCCWKKGSASAPSCIGRAGALRVPLPQHSRLMPLCTSASRNGQHEGDSGKELRDVCLSKAGAAVLSTLLLLGSPVGVQPSAAVDLGTLQQQEQQAVGNPYTSLAKPLPKQSVDKKRVWTILLGGAVVLFTSTLVVENLEGFFPAIARANKAMALSRKKAEQQERKQNQAISETVQTVATQQQQQPQQQQQQSSAAVEAGLAEARQKVLGGASAAQQPSQVSAPAPPSTSFPPQLDSGLQGQTSSSTTSSNSGSSSTASSSSSSNNNSDDGPGTPPAAPPSSSPAQVGGAQASTVSAESAGQGARSEGEASPSDISGSTNSSDGKAWLTNDEINAARSMRMQLAEPGASGGAAEAGGSGVGGADAAAVALQPGAPSGANDSAAAAAAAVAVAVGSSASKTARLEKFVGGVMREGNQAGFLSGMKQGGRAPRS